MGKIKQQKGIFYTEMEPQDVMNEFFDKLANKQHEIWSHWMKYQFTQCEPDDEGNLIIPKELVERWKRQMLTNYANLTHAERESDRGIVRKYLVDLVVDFMLIRDQSLGQNQDYIYGGGNAGDGNVGI